MTRTPIAEWSPYDVKYELVEIEPDDYELTAMLPSGQPLVKFSVRPEGGKTVIPGNQGMTESPVVKWRVNEVTYALLQVGPDDYELTAILPSGQPLIKFAVRAGWQNCLDQSFFVQEAMEHAPDDVRKTIFGGSTMSV